MAKASGEKGDAEQAKGATEIVAPPDRSAYWTPTRHSTGLWTLMLVGRSRVGPQGYGP